MTEVDEVVSPDNSAFEVLEDSRVWDLRGWKPTPEARKDEFISWATMTTRLRLQKVRPTETFNLQARTRGKEVFIECLSHPDAYRLYAQKAPSFVGKQRTKTRQCVVDVASIPEQKEFDIRFRSTYWTSLPEEEDRWVGIIGYEHSFKVSQLILFPPDLPFKEYWLMVAPTVEAAPVEFQGRKIVLADEQHTFLYWEVLEPKKDRVYRLHWKW